MSCPIRIDDTTEALVPCAGAGAAVGECIQLAGQAPVPLADLANAVARAGGTRLTARATS